MDVHIYIYRMNIRVNIYILMEDNKMRHASL